MIRALLVNIWKNLIEFKRYFFNSLSGILTIVIFFYLIFFGLQAVAGGTPQFGDTIDGVIVGYFMWLMFLLSFQNVSFGIIEEAQRGTLEQVFMSPIPFEFQVFSRIVGEFLINLLLVVGLMYLAAFTTGRSLNFNLITLLYLLIVGVMSALGVGMILGGIALIFKRIASFIQIVTFGSLAFTMLDVTANPILRLLPMAQTAHMMRFMTLENYTLFSYPLMEHLYLWAASAIYLLIGITVFRSFEKRAMVTGALGQY
ncbi:MAG TPA: ABC transporter [Kosmotogaceae bacterium]|nr:MAG: ABC-2 type transporter [Thermotogales bacterium 46_20]HAA86362.1 ABC transporter [Kosmotogaceae bacterium]